MVVEENRRSMKSNVAYILEREFRTGEQILQAGPFCCTRLEGQLFVLFIFRQNDATHC